MDSLLFGLRFSSKKNAGQTDTDTDSAVDKPPTSAKSTDSGGDYASSDLVDADSVADDAKTSATTGHPSSPDTDSSPTANERNTTMRLSKNNPGRIDDDFDIPNEPVVPGYTPANPMIRTSPATETRRDPTPAAVIGPKITIRGDLSGEEDLLIQGNVEGSIDLTGFHLTVGKEGVVKANLLAKSITIEGSVDGDLIGQERILIKASSNVKGNLVAERVTLEDGSKFRGSIDMESGKSNAAKKQINSDESGKSSKV